MRYLTFYDKMSAVCVTVKVKRHSRQTLKRKPLLCTCGKTVAWFMRFVTSDMSWTHLQDIIPLEAYQLRSLENRYSENGEVR